MTLEHCKNEPTNAAPKILVLMATCNGEKFIKEQLDSLARQSDVQIAVWIFDDDSKDGTTEIVEKFKNNASISITLTRNSPSTGSAARNFLQAIRLAPLSSYDFVALCDQDDVWPADKLRRAIDSLRENHADLYASASIAFWSDGAKKKIEKSNGQKKYDYLFESASHGCTYVAKAVVLSRFSDWLAHCDSATLSAVEFHDWLLYAWMRVTNQTVFIDEVPNILYRQTGSNVLGANHGLSAFKRRLKTILYGDLSKQALLIAELLNLSGQPIVIRLNRMSIADRMWFALNCFELRRQKRHALFLGLTLASSKRPENRSPLTF